ARRAGEGVSHPGPGARSRGRGRADHAHPEGEARAAAEALRPSHRADVPGHRAGTNRSGSRIVNLGGKMKHPRMIDAMKRAALALPLAALVAAGPALAQGYKVGISGTVTGPASPSYLPHVEGT